METETKTNEKPEQNTEQNTKLEWAKRERGAYWLSENGRMNLIIKNKSKNGKTIKFIAFPNKFKEPGSNQPDGRIYIVAGDFNPIQKPKEQNKTTDEESDFLE